MIRLKQLITEGGHSLHVGVVFFVLLYHLLRAPSWACNTLCMPTRLNHASYAAQLPPRSSQDPSDQPAHTEIPSNSFPQQFPSLREASQPSLSHSLCMVNIPMTLTLVLIIYLDERKQAECSRVLNTRLWLRRVSSSSLDCYRGPCLSAGTINRNQCC